MRVRMRSAVARGSWVHGVVEPWPQGGASRPFIVTWRETGLVTALPNPNVEEDLDPPTKPSSTEPLAELKKLGEAHFCRDCADADLALERARLCKGCRKPVRGDTRVYFGAEGPFCCPACRDRHYKVPR